MHVMAFSHLRSRCAYVPRRLLCTLYWSSWERSSLKWRPNGLIWTELPCIAGSGCLIRGI